MRGHDPGPSPLGGSNEKGSPWLCLGFHICVPPLRFGTARGCRGTGDPARTLRPKRPHVPWNREKAGQFTLRDIDADIVIVEIFSMYCPHCQKHAPTANRLYEIIEADKRTRGRVKLIGIGVGNSAYEVKFFKKKYTTPFPLFDDANSQILNKLTGIRTPTFFGVRKRGSEVEAFFIEQGPHDDPDAFLKDVIRKSGMSL